MRYSDIDKSKYKTYTIRMKRDKDYSAHYEKLKADVLDLKGYAAELIENK